MEKIRTLSEAALCASGENAECAGVVGNSPAVPQNAELPHGPAIPLRGTSQEN